MRAFRLLAFALFVAAFAAFALVGVRGWARGPAAAVVTHDEVPLATGNMRGNLLTHYVMMGFPWNPLRTELAALKRDLPPAAPGRSREDREKRATTILLDTKVAMPVGPAHFADLLTALQKQVEPRGVKVFTRDPQPDATIAFGVPKQECTVFEILYAARQGSQGAIVHVVTADGLCVGTDFACNAAVADSRLADARMRTAGEHVARSLDAEYRPDREDAPLAAVARDMKDQTGIEVVIDSALWENGAVVKWRGDPRPLRQALDELAEKLHAFWRVQNGRVWLLLP